MRCAVHAAGKNKIDGAIVVEIGGDQACGGGGEPRPLAGGDVGEGAVAVVAPQRLWAAVSRGRAAVGARDVEIEIAVVVVVDEGGANATGFAADADFFGDVFKFSVAVIVKEVDAGEAQTARSVRPSLSKSPAAQPKPLPESLRGRLLGDVFKFSVAEIVEEMAGAVGCAADQKEIGFAVAIEIEKSMHRDLAAEGRTSGARNTEIEALTRWDAGQ